MWEWTQVLRNHVAEWREVGYLGSSSYETSRRNFSYTSIKAAYHSKYLRKF